MASPETVRPAVRRAKVAREEDRLEALARAAAELSAYLAAVRTADRPGALAALVT